MKTVDNDDTINDLKQRVKKVLQADDKILKRDQDCYLCPQISC